MALLECVTDVSWEPISLGWWLALSLDAWTVDMLLNLSFPCEVLKGISNTLWVFNFWWYLKEVSMTQPWEAASLLVLFSSAGLCLGGRVGPWHCLHLSGSSSFPLPSLYSLPELLPLRNCTHPLPRFPIFLSPWFLLYYGNRVFFFHFNLPGHLCCSCSLSP